MPITQFLSYLFTVFFFWAAISTWQKLGRVYCIYHGEDKSVKRGWGKVKDKKLEIFGGRFDVLPECIGTTTITNGIHMIFPIQVNCLHLVWYDHFPVNPNDYKRSWDSPELRKMINLEEQLKSYFKNFNPKDKKKEAIGGFKQYLPYILVLVIFVVVMLYLNGQLNGMKTVINIMQQQIKGLIPK